LQLSQSTSTSTVSCLPWGRAILPVFRWLSMLRTIDRPLFVTCDKLPQ
jgi:hypothetical protein